MHAITRFRSARSSQLLALDLRSLALFRAALAFLLFWDSACRLGLVNAFYSDAGLMPRAWLASFGDPSALSLHLVGGQAWFQVLLIGLQMLAALAMFFGWRTRLAIALAWALNVSLAARNPLALTPADLLMNALLFWSLFLPVHARWSADAALSGTPTPRESRASWASAALLIQILSVYFFSGLALGSIDGDAVRETLRLEHLAYPWTASLLAIPRIEDVIALWLRGVLVFGPLLALSPFFTRSLRTLALLNLALLNLGLAALFAIGPFPYLALAGLAALTGGGFWERLARARARRQGAGELRIYYEADCAFCAKTSRLLRELLILPDAKVEPASSSARAQALLQANRSWVVVDRDDSAHLKWSATIVLLRRSPLLWPLARLLGSRRLSGAGDRAYDFVARHRARFAKGTTWLLKERDLSFEAAAWTRWLAAAGLSAVLLWNLVNARVLPAAVQSALAPVVKPLGLDQNWDAFAYLPREEGWFVALGEQLGGTTVDVLRPQHGATEYLPPRWPALEHGNARWQAYRARLLLPRFESQRAWWARHLCRQWNSELARDAPSRLRSLRLIYLLHPAPPATTATEQRVLWREDCR